MMDTFVIHFELTFSKISLSSHLILLSDNEFIEDQLSWNERKTKYDWRNSYGYNTTCI